MVFAVKIEIENMSASNISTQSNNDIFFLYIIPVICILCLLLNMLNFLIFSTKIFKEVLFQYFKMQSLFICLNLLIKCLFPLYYCKTCSTASMYISQFYFKYFIVYAASVLEMSAILCQIISTYFCFRLISKKQTTFHCSYVLISLFVIAISGLVYLYQLFEYQINEYELILNFVGYTKNMTIFKTEYGSFHFNVVMSIIEIAAFTLRDGLSSVVLIVLNILIFIKVRKNLKRKKRMVMEKSTVNNDLTDNTNSLTKVDRSQIRLTIMVLVSCANCLVGRTPILLFFILRNFLEELQLAKLLYFAISCIYFSYFISFFLYYITNKKFKYVLKKCVFRILRYAE